MLLKVPVIVAVLGTSVVVANDVPTLLRRTFAPSSSLKGRQGSGNISNWIPAACQSECATTLQYVQYCATANDVPACTSICTQSGFNDFVQCIQCGINNNPSYAANNIQALNAGISQIAWKCNAAGSSVSGATLVATSMALSGTNSATGSTTVAASQTGSAGITMPSSGSTASGATASGSSTAGATTSKSAASAVRPLNFVQAAGAAVVGLIGVAGGAALAL